MGRCRGHHHSWDEMACSLQLLDAEATTAIARHFDVVKSSSLQSLLRGHTGPSRARRDTCSCTQISCEHTLPADFGGAVFAQEPWDICTTCAPLPRTRYGTRTSGLPTHVRSTSAVDAYIELRRASQSGTCVHGPPASSENSEQNATRVFQPGCTLRYTMPGTRRAISRRPQ